MAKHQTIAALAEAIADGSPVDWAAAESTAATEWERAAIRRLRRIGLVADRQRRAVAGPAVPPAPKAGVTGLSETKSAQHWGHLLVLEQVGRGSFGEVYRARDPRLDRDVALKLLRTPDAPRGTRASIAIDEGRLLARIRHPNIVTVYGADRIDGRVGIWMDFINGRTLDQVLREHGPLGSEEATLIGLDLCRALAAVHQAGLVHRDVKAQNVMREDGGRVVLMDFGAGSDKGDSNLDATDRLTGTPLYLAPEVLRGDRASTRSDIYSLGVLLYHLVTGSYPIVGRTLAEVNEAHRLGKRRHVRDTRPDLSAAFVQVVERAAAADPPSRYGTAGEMEAALSESLAGVRHLARADAGEGLPATVVKPVSHETGPAAAPPERPGYLRDWAAAHRLVALAAVLLVAVGVAGAAWLLYPRPAAPTSGARDFVLITAFQNHTDQPRLGDAIKASLEYELVNSRVVSVVPQARVEDALRLMRRNQQTLVDSAVGREICQRDRGIRSYLAGSVEQVGATYVLTASVFDPSDGHAIASASESAAMSDIVAAIRRLSNRVRESLGEAHADVVRSNQELQNVTTPSLEALRLYSESYQGPRHPSPNEPQPWSSSLRLVDEALLLDPDFATAHIWRAWALRNTGAPATEVQAEASRAMSLRGTCTTWERYWIEGSYDSILGDQDRAIALYQTLLKLYPTHEWALHNLAVAERARDRWDEALPYLVRLATLRPLDTIASLNAMEAATRVADWPDAERYAATVRALVPTDGWRNLDELAWMLGIHEKWRQGDIPGALREVDRLTGALGQWQDPARSDLAVRLSTWYFVLGRTRDAERAIAFAADRDLRAVTLARAAYWRGDDVALSARLPVTNDDLNLYDTEEWTLMLVKAGRVRDAEALVESRASLPQFAAPGSQLVLSPLRAYVLAAEGKFADALALIQRTNEDRRGSAKTLWLRGEVLANLLIRQGQTEEAANMLRRTAWKQSDWVEGALIGMRDLAMLANLDRRLGKAAEADKIESDLRSWLSEADPDFVLFVHAQGGAPARPLPGPPRSDDRHEGFALRRP